MNRKVTAIILTAITAASLAACSTAQDATPAPTVTVTQTAAPRPAVTVTAAPKPAPTVTVTQQVEVPVPGPTVTMPALPEDDPTPAPVEDFKPGSKPALKDPYTGAAIPFPTIPAGMHFEEDDVEAYQMWVSFRNFKKIPVGTFADYRKEYVGTYDDWNLYAKFEEEGKYSLIPLDSGGFAVFK